MVHAEGGKDMSDVEVQNKNGGEGEVTTLKILQNKAHNGPSKGVKSSKTDLSKAVGKIKFNNNLKLEAIREESAITQKPNTSVSFSYDLSTEEDPVKFALYTFMAWDKVYGTSQGTTDYMDKLAKLYQAKADFYEKWGIPYTPNVGKRPVLTEAQRVDYNETVSKSSFDYYEYRLSFKQPGVKAVRTTVYRTLVPLNFEDISNRLASKRKVISTTVKIHSDKPSN
jgi:hypothetical protein